MHTHNCTMLPTHRCLLLPQPVDLDWVVKALKLYQEVSKKTYDKQIRNLPPLEPGDKVWIRPNRDRVWCEAEVFPLSYLMRNEQRCVYRRNRRQIILLPEDHLITPWLSESLSNTQICDIPKSTSSLSAVNQFQRSQMEPTEKLTGDAEHEPITTRSGCEVRKPQRLNEFR